ncbi:hypothetical protein DFH06DRAFT_1135752 [Mycena polygramma]|nr:hypothetical protein DFH06DRAFT_1135752 [Mycena polygramma]
MSYHCSDQRRSDILQILNLNFDQASQKQADLGVPDNPPTETREEFLATIWLSCFCHSDQYRQYRVATRHLQLWRSNEPPEETEVTPIRSVASNVATRLVALNEEIALLRDRLKQLEDKRESLSRFHRESTAILSPLRRMPTEILLEIFSWTMPPIAVVRRRVKLSLTHSPWVFVAAGETFGSRPVFLTAHGRESDRTRPKAEDSLLWARIIRLSTPGGLTRRKIEGHQYRLRNDPPSMSNHCAIKIQHTSLWETPESQAGITESLDFFQSAPSLIDASIYNEYRSIQFLLPWQNLTRYHLDAPWDVQRLLLKMAPNIVEARIFVAFDLEPWPDSNEITDLIFLRRLFISHAEILDYLTTPHLEELAIYLRADEPSDFVDRLMASSCPLRKLTLAGGPTLHPMTKMLKNFRSSDVQGPASSPEPDQAGPGLEQAGPGPTQGLSGPKAWASKIPTSAPREVLAPKYSKPEKARAWGLKPWSRARAWASEISSPSPLKPGPSRGFQAKPGPEHHYSDTDPDVPILAPQLSGIHFAFMNGEYRNCALCLEMIKSRWSAPACALKSSALLTDSTACLNLFMLQGYDAVCSEGLDLDLLHGQEALFIKDMWLYSTSWN